VIVMRCYIDVTIMMWNALLELRFSSGLVPPLSPCRLRSCAQHNPGCALL
jgi:hypothetical protein